MSLRGEISSFVVGVGGWVLLSGSHPCFAEEAEMQPQVQPQTEHSEQSTKVPKSGKRAKKGNILREKEAEGTQAPNRFESTDSIPKSVYRDEQTGQPYEVDTD